MATYANSTRTTPRGSAPKPRKKPRRPALSKRIERAFSAEILADICAMDEEDFVDAYEMGRVSCPDASAPFYAFKDNQSPILGVAHLDTVAHANTRRASFSDTEAGPVIHSRALDDRLGAYVLADLLPALGIPRFDLLVTTGEEIGRSTAQHFITERDYNWIIEFDRGGTDVVLYDYQDDATEDLVSEHAKVGVGSYSDISWMEHVGVKAFNWGVGYQDYHGPRAHAYLRDTFSMVEAFCGFWEANRDTQLPHDPDTWWLEDDDSTSGSSHWFGECEMCSQSARVSRCSRYGVPLCDRCERDLF